jgi:hypothetical protein
MFVLEPFGLRLTRWDVPEKMQGKKITTKNRLQCRPQKKQGRPEFPNGLALQLFQRMVSVLCRSPPAGLIFLPEPSAIWGFRRVPTLHHLLLFALQTEPDSGQRFFKCCCAAATILASRHGGT